MDPAATAETAPIGRLLAGARARLAGEDRDALLETEILLAHVLGTGRTWLHAHPEAEPAPADVARFLALVDERADRHTPIAYLTGRR